MLNTEQIKLFTIRQLRHFNMAMPKQPRAIQSCQTTCQLSSRQNCRWRSIRKSTLALTFSKRKRRILLRGSVHSFVLCTHNKMTIFIRRPNILQKVFIIKYIINNYIVYFLSKGKAGYVLPRYSNCIYIEIEQGQHFGHLELANNKSFFKEEKSFKKSLNKHKDTIKRSFTIRALITCDLLTLSMDDLDLMKVEFHDVYFELIKDARETLLQYLNIKKQEIQKREIEKTKQKSNLNSKLSGMILSNLQKSLHDNVESPK